MNFTRNQIIIIGAVILIIIFFVLAFIFFKREDIAGQKEIKLEFWGVEEEGAIRSIIESYQAQYPNVKIAYQQFEENNYEKTLLNALASGQGPDILMLHNTWLNKHADKISANQQMSLTDIRELFPSVVEKDFTLESKIYGLPLYLDNLVLIYNKDYFDAKGIAVVPKTWESFQNIIPRLKEMDLSGRISKAGLAIGGSQKTLPNASDLLSLIMLQYADLRGLNTDSAGPNKTNLPFSLQAFNFYLQFANPASQYYTWNDNLRPSLDNFSQEGVAAIFGYASDIAVIKSKNPFINLAISAMLQFSSAKAPVNYANYWGLTVSHQSKNSQWAWHFIQTTATNSETMEQYLKAAIRPPALRTLIAKYQNDPDLGIFANQALTSHSWLQPDNNEVKKIFSEAIEAVLTGRLTPQRALEEAENRINNL